MKQLRRDIIQEATNKGIKDIQGLTSLIERIASPHVLGNMLKSIQTLKKWYEVLEITPQKGQVEYVVFKKTPADIGESLSDLVEIALSDLGCNVVPRGAKMIKGLPFVYDKNRKKYVARLRFNSGLPSLGGIGKFQTKGIRFERLPNMKDEPDFVSDKVALEVKNRDPSYPYRTKKLFWEEVLRRFKKVRKKERYLLIPRGVLTSQNRRELGRRKIHEVNLTAQLRGINQIKLYKEIFRRLGRILSTHYP